MLLCSIAACFEVELERRKNVDDGASINALRCRYQSVTFINPRINVSAPLQNTYVLRWC